MRERLKAKPNEVLAEHLFRPAIIEDSVRSYENMIYANLAHVLMLHKQDIICRATASQISRVLLQMRERGTGDLELNPEYEDLYFNMEKHVIDKTSGDVGGKMHTGRSRNDLYATITRMNVRDIVINIYDLLIKTRTILLHMAEENKETVITGYTHMQPAQPITFAHYLLAISETFERDFERLKSAYCRLNKCPLGGGAFAGTSFDIDRYYTAELLGFDSIVQNSIDSVVSRDYLLEFMSCFTIIGLTMSRVAHDLYIWSTDEFRYVEVDNSLAACSSIMPQKKNPITLEHIKAKASHFLGAYVSISACIKNVPFNHCRDVSAESLRGFWDATGQVETTFMLLNETLKTIKVNNNRMRNRVNSNFSTVTELADALVVKEDISFRQAHEIVGSIVADCVGAGLSARDISAEMLNEKAQEFIKRKLKWNQEDVADVLDATKTVIRKKSIGGPAPEESTRLIKLFRDNLTEDIAWYKDIVWKLDKTNKKLMDAANNITKG